MLELTLEIAAVVGIACLLAWYFRPPCNLRILVNGGKIDIRGRALTAHGAELSDFFRRELADVHRARVEGFWNGRYLRLHCRGLSPGQQQRLRNYLLTVI